MKTASYFKKHFILKNAEYVAQIVITDIGSLNDQDNFKINDSNDKTNDKHDVDDSLLRKSLQFALTLLVSL